MAYTQQPGATPQMNAGGNRNALNKPFNAQGEREWSNGLCDFGGDCGTCCVAWLAPCLIYGQNKSRLQHLEEKGYPHPSGGAACTGDCCLHACLIAVCGAGCCLQIPQRGATRARYRIEGGGCGDCMASTWCSPCELTQESREIELEEQSMRVKA